MTSEDPKPNSARRGSPLVERITAIVLVLVLLSLGWMIVVAFAPEVARFAAVEVEAVVVLILLGAALVLVSVVALLHTG